jgi:hypothetical protein
MKIPTLIKILPVIGIILWICFETLQFFNRQYALEGGKRFLKIHNATVESIDCDVPALSFAIIDGSTRFCTFKATPEQIEVLVKNLDLCPINSVNSDENGAAKKYGECIRQALTEEEAKPENLRDYDELRSASIEEHICWSELGLNNRSELELYGTYANKESKVSRNFYVFYKKTSRTGCVRFITAFK